MAPYASMGTFGCIDPFHQGLFFSSKWLNNNFSVYWNLKNDNTSNNQRSRVTQWKLSYKSYQLQGEDDPSTTYSPTPISIGQLKHIRADGNDYWGADVTFYWKRAKIATNDWKNGATFQDVKFTAFCQFDFELADWSTQETMHAKRRLAAERLDDVDIPVDYYHVTLTYRGPIFGTDKHGKPVKVYPTFTSPTLKQLDDRASKDGYHVTEKQISYWLSQPVVDSQQLKIYIGVTFGLVDPKVPNYSDIWPSCCKAVVRTFLNWDPKEIADEQLAFNSLCLLFQSGTAIISNDFPYSWTTKSFTWTDDNNGAVMSLGGGKQFAPWLMKRLRPFLAALECVYNSKTDSFDFGGQHSLDDEDHWSYTFNDQGLGAFINWKNDSELSRNQFMTTLLFTSSSSSILIGVSIWLLKPGVKHNKDKFLLPDVLITFELFIKAVELKSSSTKREYREREGDTDYGSGSKVNSNSSSSSSSSSSSTSESSSSESESSGKSPSTGSATRSGSSGSSSAPIDDDANMLVFSAATPYIVSYISKSSPLKQYWPKVKSSMSDAFSTYIQQGFINDTNTNWKRRFYLPAINDFMGNTPYFSWHGDLYFDIAYNGPPE